MGIDLNRLSLRPVLFIIYMFACYKLLSYLHATGSLVDNFSCSDWLPLYKAYATTGLFI